jgi:teichoic acid transport system ATP-binding protein
VADLNAPAMMSAETPAQASAPDAAVPPKRRQPRIGNPTVIVEDVHIVYRVHGGSKQRAGGTTATSALKRIMSGAQPPTVTEIHAVKGISFTAHQGEAIGLIGSNGSGKSTILRAIAGLLPVESGQIFTAGQPSLLGANAALLNDLSGEENVVLGLLAMGMSRQEARDKCAEIIEFSGINERGNFSALPMSTYSSGMAARLRFSIASAKRWPPATPDSAVAASVAYATCCPAPERCSWSATHSPPWWRRARVPSGWSPA